MCVTTRSFSSIFRNLTSNLGSVHNFLPLDVIEEIWRTWLGHNSFERLPDLNAKEPELFCAKRGLSFEKCDLIFEFMGSDKQTVSHRCDAQNFLGSPWTTDPPQSAKVCLMNRPKSTGQNTRSYGTEPTYILGMVSAILSLWSVWLYGPNENGRRVSSGRPWSGSMHRTTATMSRPA